VRPTTALIVGLFAILLFAAPAGAREYAVWGGCKGGQELLKPVKLDHCTRDVTYSLYVDRVQLAAFGDAQATGIGTAYVNPCDVNCSYGVWYPRGSASVTLSKPVACGDRRLYSHGQLQDPYEGRSVFEEDYPGKLVLRQCRSRLFNGSLRDIAQRATTCAKATKLAVAWAKASGYRHVTLPRANVKVGAYRCRRATRGRHQLAVSCRASGKRLVQFRASR
jgi:hypothetical protein